MKQKQIGYLIFTVGLVATLFLVNNDLPADEGNRNEDEVRVMFYNVENLFDTIDDPITSDEEYLPESELNWTSDKYWDKTKKLAQVITAVGEMELPVIIGVCEIENRLVLENLAKVDPIKSADYQIVHYNSPDKRGIDVGLLYRPDKFKLIDSQSLEVTLPEDSTFFTRDILYVKGIVSQKDTMHFYVNHWPSRRGGQEASEHKRLKAASVVREHIDSLRGHNPNTKIVMMGDFNDGPNNKSIAEIINGKERITDPSSEMLNLMKALPNDQGTHKYRGEWEYLDQILISSSLTEPPLYAKGNRAEVYRGAFLLKKDDRYTGLFPIRSFRGPHYAGGFSDHLPVYVDFVLKSK